MTRLTEKQKIYLRKRYWADPQAQRDRVQAYRDINRDAINARRRERYKTYKFVARKGFEAWKLANPDYFSQYKRNNKDKVNANTTKRYTEKLKRSPPWLEDRHYIEMQKFYSEATRLTKLTNVNFHVDHIVPLQGKNVSGLHVPWNLQVIPYYENQSKGNRLAT